MLKEKKTVCFKVIKAIWELGSEMYSKTSIDYDKSALMTEVKPKP